MVDSQKPTYENFSESTAFSCGTPQANKKQPTKMTLEQAVKEISPVKKTLPKNQGR